MPRLPYLTLIAPAGAMCLLATLLAVTSPARAQAPLPADTPDETLSEIVRLAAGGTPSLALRLLDRGQPSPDTHRNAWARWERARVHVLEGSGQWEAVAHRLGQRPDGLSREFGLWADERMAVALNHLGRGAEARERLQTLIWRSDPVARSQNLPHWRRLVIRSYLADGAIGDAQTAMLRYALDYPDEEGAWRVLRARVLLSAGRAEEAAQAVSTPRTPEEVLLNVVARARAGALEPARIRPEARRLLGKQVPDPEVDTQLWAAVAEAARLTRDTALEVEALEAALGGRAPEGEPELVRASPAGLWDAYVSRAVDLANAKRLLVGSFESWLEAARAHAAEKRPRDARALYAYLTLKADSGPVADAAEAGLLAGLRDSVEGRRIVAALYLHSGRYPGPYALPVSVRYVLVENALEESDIELASQLMRTLTTPPDGMDTLAWELRRARVMVLGGQAGEGAAVLRALLDADRGYDGEQLDRINQVLFDLQAIGEHDAAVELFGATLGRVSDGQRAREVLYWMGDSRMAQARYEEAAQLFLRSAHLPGAGTADAWAQTARYQAAEALARAGLMADARRVYEGLLKLTEDPERKAVLRRAIQRLWLDENRAGGATAAAARR